MTVTYLAVICQGVWTTRKFTESPRFQLLSEYAEILVDTKQRRLLLPHHVVVVVVVVVDEHGQNSLSKQVDIVNAPGASLREPRYNVFKILIAENGKEFGW